VSGNVAAPGLYSVSYAADGTNLTIVGSANVVARNVNLAGCCVDTTRKFIIDCNNSGLFIYSYDYLGNFSSALSSITGKSFINARVDTINRIIYADAVGDGLFIYKYSEEGTTLTEIASDDHGGIYSGLAIDTENPLGNIVMTVDSGNGFYSYINRLVLSADWTREPAGNVNVGQNIKFTPTVTLE